MEPSFDFGDKCRSLLLNCKYSLPVQPRRFISNLLIRLILRATTIMNIQWLGRDDCAIVAEDIARARSTLLSLRARIDTNGHDKVYAYGQALLHVAGLISTTFGVSEEYALTARNMGCEEIDRVYRDLFSCVRRCRSIRDEGTPGSEMADNLAMACSVLKNLYRMRFHAEKASGSQKVEAEDLADRLTTLAQALTELGSEAEATSYATPMKMAA
ncbi:hypothetical protein IC232_05510 [Microvirga sp. BT688]|uniref:hypothetical protein n=1 Tax=Microvirga sp. TaxID=1873136 RepID=UPI001686FA1E|nr:hypothetical protein [Microvirga sp.]MBD2746155.1 hypothetical protein [Microvirga sp.]